MTREQVLASLKRHRRLFIRAYLFGSLARNEGDAYSDADIIFVRDTAKDFFHRVTEIMDIMFELGDVDALIYTPDEFARMREESGFIQSVTEEAIAVEGEQNRG